MRGRNERTMKTKVRRGREHSEGRPTSADVAKAEAMGAIKVAMVSRRDRILMAALAALLCAAYVSLYRVGNDVAWAVLAIVAGVGVIWFGFTAASSLQWAKSSVVALDEYDGHTSDADGIATAETRGEK